jgi:hypothetical protein
MEKPVASKKYPKENKIINFMTKLLPKGVSSQCENLDIRITNKFSKTIKIGLRKLFKK